jgi:uncharacterized LabA/DUF88 family protein
MAQGSARPAAGSSTCIYVDVENVKRSAAELLGKPPQPFIVDPEALRRELARRAPRGPGRRGVDWSAATVVMFTGTPPAPEHPGWIWYQPLRYLWTSAERVQVRDHPVIVARDEHTGKTFWKQDAVDVLLAVTAVQDAIESRFHSIMIVSGDSDLAPAVQACAERLGRPHVLTAALEGSWRRDADPPAIRLGAAAAERLDMRERLNEVAVHYADLFSIEDDTGSTQARKFVENLAASAPLTARRALTRAYLDAVWWWDNYEAFPLCQKLISRWDSYLGRMKAKHRPGHQRLLTALQAFDREYPRGHDEDKLSADPAQWAAIGDAAADLAELLELTGELSQPAERHVAALVEIYRAEAHRFRAGDDHGLRAVEHYQRAAQLFGDNGERWNLAWVQCDWAALSYERGQLARALELCAEAEKLGRELGSEPGEVLDHELLAKLSAVRAQSYLRPAGATPGEQDAGWAHAAAALRHACAFQVRPGSHPDEYTQEFCTDIRAKVQRLLEAADPARREQAEQVLADGWLGLWPEQPGPSADHAEELLGPPPPTEAELSGSRKFRYVDRIGPIVDLLDEEGALGPAGG